MKMTLRELREIIHEELQGSQYPGMLDTVLPALQQVTKTLESAHQQAPDPESKTIIAGIHSDLFNTIAQFRGNIRQLKATAARGQQQGQSPQQPQQTAQTFAGR